jgi:hypothetical protein
MYDTFRKSFKFFDIPMSFIAGRTSYVMKRNCLKDRHPLKHLFTGIVVAQESFLAR